jgi:hypothetical protein
MDWLGHDAGTSETRIWTLMMSPSKLMSPSRDVYSPTSQLLAAAVLKDVSE